MMGCDGSGEFDEEQIEEQIFATIPELYYF
jgi:hypothetical protein